MRDKAFLDSNIILYSYSRTEYDKNKIANELIFSIEYTLISTQVINEITNILYKKFKIDTESIKNVILEIGK
ncbi:hypothetical protein [Hydrogenimonas thermophila]|uniref:PIN domain-containing protein n=1 Tax=Hydrogenimonas thermophila TaxID=223786 RepID=A0A1I5KRZ7_9BACT|nr:hypothetical protein [Hydrogenimonas thermophila]SFO87406.1 hypothetical protein SAMN05216234_10144 [Hydrogenimonas thermophila]